MLCNLLLLGSEIQTKTKLGMRMTPLEIIYFIVRFKTISKKKSKSTNYSTITKLKAKLKKQEI